MAKRNGSSSSMATSKSSSMAPASPWWTALLIFAAIGYATWVLVQRGRLSWPPYGPLASAYTIAGGIALIGPIVLAKWGDAGEPIGERIWRTGGFLIWILDLASIARGQIGVLQWITPVDAGQMGLIMLAVMASGWSRSSGGGFRWSWTNLVGWCLGVLWGLLGLLAVWDSLAVRWTPR